MSHVGGASNPVTSRLNREMSGSTLRIEFTVTLKGRQPYYLTFTTHANYLSIFIYGGPIPPKSYEIPLTTLVTTSLCLFKVSPIWKLLPITTGKSNQVGSIYHSTQEGYFPRTIGYFICCGCEIIAVIFFFLILMHKLPLWINNLWSIWNPLSLSCLHILFINW